MKAMIWGFLALIVVVVIWQAVTIYHHVTLTEMAKENRAINEVKQSFPVKKILSVHEFRGSEAYEVVKAQLLTNNPLWIWVSEKENKAIPITANANEGYTKKEILQLFNAKVPHKRLIQTTLGLSNQSVPIWEIIYVDSSGDYVFSYYDYYTGKATGPPIAFKASNKGS